jgi:hypothetical protein
VGDLGVDAFPAPGGVDSFLTGDGNLACGAWKVLVERVDNLRCKDR